jgi:TPR repeat protein
VYAADEARVDEAVSWLRLAAEAGRGSSAVNLGVRYLRGNGLEQDRRRGVRWLERGADLGEPSALLPLAQAVGAEPGLVEGGREEALRWVLTAKENAGEGIAGQERRLRDSLEAREEDGAEQGARIWWERKRSDPDTPIGRVNRWLQTRFESGREWANWEVAFLAGNVECPAPRLQRLAIDNYEASGHFDACMLDALAAYGVR